MTRANRRRERGMTVLEVVIASAVMLVALTGFVATANIASNSTALAHRMTSLSFLRSGLLERVAVLPRGSLAALAANGGWFVEACYDQTGARLDDPTRTLSPSYACPTGWFYRTHLRATVNGTAPQWPVQLYVERANPGCTAANRQSSSACIAADLLLTD
jgi:Tfp pilus assembly protein PilV